MCSATKTDPLNLSVDPNPDPDPEVATISTTDSAIDANNKVPNIAQEVGPAGPADRDDLESILEAEVRRSPHWPIARCFY